MRVRRCLLTAELPADAQESDRSEALPPDVE